MVKNYKQEFAASSVQCSNSCVSSVGRCRSRTDACIHTDGKASDRGGNEETPQVFSSLLLA